MATRLPQQRIDIGNVMSLGFRVLGRNFLPFAAFALLLVGLPSFLSQYLAWNEIRNFDTESFGAFSGYYWGGIAESRVTAYLLQGVVVAVAVRDLNGRQPDLGADAAAALGRLIPIIALAIVSGIAITFGLILLIVPGIILTLMWSVAVPVMIEERRGVFESLGRSAELTRGSKGWIFLLLLLYWGASSMLSGMTFAMVGFRSPAAEPAMTVAPLVVGALAQAVSGLLLAALLAALYVELRHFKEGASVDQLAGIFE